MALAANTVDFEEAYEHLKTVETPAHVSALSFGHSGHLCVGADDGSLRVYDLSTFKVIKAIRGLEEEISSLVCVKRSGSELRDVWLASGRRIMKFQMESTKMIQMVEDAISVAEVEGAQDDVLNELSLNPDKTHLAFCMDSGVVGILELATLEISKMTTSHENVCGNVKCLASHPREMVSGGYDQKLMHYDFTQKTLLSSCQMPAPDATGGMSLSLPFIMSTAISPTGIFVAGTADGRLWISFGGVKKTRKKKPKTWPGLNEDNIIIKKIFEGPIVAMAFDNAGVLTMSTLLGVITRFVLGFDEQGQMELRQVWRQESKRLEKVNALVVDEKRIVVGGFAKNGRGVIEIWRKMDKTRSDYTDVKA